MTILRTVNVSKAYDGVQALQNVLFDLRAGEVHALVGENGAGKSTLIKIVTGAVTPDSGSGAGIIYISHRLEELSVVADRVTVLTDGEVVATRPMQGLTVRELISLMVGRELSAVFPKRSVPIGEPTLRRALSTTRHGQDPGLAFRPTWARATDRF